MEQPQFWQKECPSSFGVLQFGQVIIIITPFKFRLLRLLFDEAQTNFSTARKTESGGIWATLFGTIDLHEEFLNIYYTIIFGELQGKRKKNTITALKNS